MLKKKTSHVGPAWPKQCPSERVERGSAEGRHNNVQPHVVQHGRTPHAPQAPRLGYAQPEPSFGHGMGGGGLGFLFWSNFLLMECFFEFCGFQNLEETFSLLERDWKFQIWISYLQLVWIFWMHLSNFAGSYSFSHGPSRFIFKFCIQVIVKGIMFLNFLWKGKS